MVFFMRVLTVVTVTMMAPMLQVSHAIMHKIPGSAGWTTINVDHYDERGGTKTLSSNFCIAAQIPSMLTYGGLDDKMKRWHFNNAGGPYHHQQEEVDGIHLPVKRTIFLGFNKDFPIDEQEVIDFFTERFGAIEAYIPKGRTHAFIVFRKTHIALSVVSEGEKKFNINGTFVWAKKYIH